MGLPSISVSFKETGTTAIQRGQRGTVALILKDATNNGAHLMKTTNDIPDGLSTDNKTQIQLAFMGSVNPPTAVLAYVEPAAAADYSEAETYLEGTAWDYLAVPGIVSGDTTAMATWVKGLRDTKGRKVKAVLPDTAADHEGIINFATDTVTVGLTTYTAAQYCSRIAGILAGLPLDISSTYQVLPEVTDVPHLTNDQFNTAIDAGKLVLMKDIGTGDVKIARGVNSLVTLTADKGVDFQKIKIVDIMDLINGDIVSTSNASYIGKMANSYDNKCLLVMAIRAYFEILEGQQLLDRGQNTLDIDTTAQGTYLQSIGTDTSKMTDQQIKEANTRDQVFLAGTVKILDAVEDITLALAL